MSIQVSCLCIGLVWACSEARSIQPDAARKELLTVAEQSQFRATARHAEVVHFCEQLAKRSLLVRLGQLGTSYEGRKLPLLILADPPVATPQEALRSGKLVIYAQGNIHAGEVDGKEGLLMLARELATDPEHPLLKKLIIVFAPIFNADGNERMAKNNRPGQVGPEEGMGVRHNAQGLDLNRDFVKLETPEVRALVRFIRKWDPAVVIDCHTTNGSYHRYTLTYEGPRCPAGDSDLVRLVRDELLPDVSKRLEKRTGFHSFYYGNYSNDHKRWETVPATPRFGTLYVGLRNRIGILSESYSYASYKERILASRDFVRSILEYTADNEGGIRKALNRARARTIEQGRDPAAQDTVAVRSEASALPKPFRLLGFAEEQKEGGKVTKEPKDYEIQYWGDCKPKLLVRRPWAYVVPSNLSKTVENLQRHGVEVQELREDIELNLEAYQIKKITHASSAFQKHRSTSLETAAHSINRRISAGAFLVRTEQPLGDLIVYLLEPGSEDGLVTWNFFDNGLAEGQDFPVMRLTHPTPVTSGPIRALPEDRTLNKPVVYDPEGGPGLNFAGTPVSGLTWLIDGEHFLQIKAGRLYRVDAVSGNAEPFDSRPSTIRGAGSSFRSPSTSGSRRSGGEGGAFGLMMNPDRSGRLVVRDNDLYHHAFKTGKEERLMQMPAGDEANTISFSPDGKAIAFVRGGNLHVLDIATKTERALTADGSTLISNGKADWVYGEEIFGRGNIAYWWSSDCRRLAYLRIDDGPVHRFTVIDHIPSLQTVETTPYPKAGDPNPTVKLGIASVNGSLPHLADLGNYSETASLIIRAGWTPDSQQVYFYVQDRAQTWLDFCTLSKDGGTPRRLFRETTGAWVNDPGPPHYLSDGSFLLFSERSGWKHLYHFDSDGKLLGPVTKGLWEVRQVHLVDEKNGWIYFSGMRDSAIAQNLYRVRLDGNELERLTKASGNHEVSVSPKGNFFIDSFSSFQCPTRVVLCRTSGESVRMLDTNPVYDLEEYRLGKCKLVQISTPDSFILHGSLTLPPDFDPTRKYPVWFMTYGGPHFPMTSDSWQGGHVEDQMLARLGIVAFRVDPRSASGKGAAATWSAYRSLGIQELKDIETAIHWLKAFPYIDGSRIGMSGHSYGGFMTAYAMTHSKLFSAGIAGAPVTDWRTYDTIYTERYMNTPQENPEGYDATSVVKAVANLHGKLLIVHGIMDDNVHIQNTIQLVEALQEANKDFEVMFYPRSRHGIRTKHYQKLRLEFIKRTMLGH
jgi:dipeptidyl aminopeptidase/acylaminoacyl peptidase